MKRILLKYSSEDTMTTMIWKQYVILLIIYEENDNEESYYVR